MLTNIIYIALLIIFILFIYWAVKEEPIFEHPHPVVVQIGSDVIKSDITAMIDHLSIVKNNLIDLNKIDYSVNIMDATNIKHLNHLINATNKDLANFTHQNNFDDIIIRLDPDHELQQLIGRKINNIRETRSDLLDVHFERFEIDNVVIDLNAVIYLLQHDRINGRIVLTNLYKLITFLVRLLPSDKEHLSYYDVYKDIPYHTPPPSIHQGYVDDNGEDNHYKNELTNDYGVIGKMPHINAKNVNLSQNSTGGYGTLQNDGEQYCSEDLNILLANIAPTPAPRMGQNLMNTQLLSGSDVARITKRDHIQPYLPFCNLRRIKEDYEAKRRYILDNSSPASLRSDYKF